MLKRHNIVLNMVLLVLALCVVFFACMPIHSYAEDESGYGTEVEWGYANADKGVKWTQYQDGDVVTLVLELTETGQSSDDDAVKAIKQLLGQDASTSRRSALSGNTTKIVVKDGITGIGWKAIRKNDNEPKYDGSYYDDNTQNTETDVFASFTKLKKVEPCSTIKRIGWSAFRKCSNLKSFDFTKCTDLEEIMTQAFNPCGLEEVDLSECSKLETIRTSAFRECNQLESVAFPNSLKVIGTTAFNGSGLKSVTIPGSVTEIYNKAFYGCGSLETVVFEESDSTETDIYNEAFRNSGVRTVTFSKNVIKIRRQAFEDCADLETVRFTDASTLSSDFGLQQKAFNNDTKLGEVIDEKTKRLAFTKPAAKKLFSIEYNDNVFANTKLGGIVDLGIEVKDKTSDYNGDTQNGYVLTDTDYVTVTGLVDPDKLTEAGYTPSSGKYKGSYENGSFNKDQLEVMRGEYFTTDNYNVGTLTPGDLTINQVDLTISMADRTLPYSGQTQYGWARTDAGKETVTGLVHNETVTITYSPSSGKTAGTYTNGAYTESSLQIKDGDTDVTENYNLTSATAGKLTIEKDEKELKVASASKDWDYDAGTHTYKVYTVTYGTEKIEGTEGQTVFTLSTGDKVTVTPTGKGASGVKNVSDSGANSFTWTVENEGSYTKGTDKVGTLTINKAPLTITAKDQEFTYNGQIQGEGDTVYTTPADIASKLLSVVGLKGSETLTSIELFGQATDAGEYSGRIAPNSAVISSSADNYDITYVGGKLTINKAPLTITTPSGTKVYDGTPITRPNGTVTGLVNGETATVTGTGSQTAVGSSQNGYKIVWGSAKEANYEIVSENLGTLTVTAATGGGGNDGNAAAPATGGGTITPGTPEGEAIDDEPVPAADTPEEPQVIDDPDVPLADNGGWALVNLLCMLGTAGLFAAMLARFIKKRQEGERAGIIYVIAGLAVAVFSALIFFMTEDMKLPMIMTDKWTLLMAVILAVQLAVAFLLRVRTADEDEEE